MSFSAYKIDLRTYLLVEYGLLQHCLSYLIDAMIPNATQGSKDISLKREGDSIA